MLKKLFKIVKAAFGDAGSFQQALNNNAMNEKGTKSFEQVAVGKVNNNALNANQRKLLVGVLLAMVVILLAVIGYVQEKSVKTKPISKSDALRVELADKALDGDEMWRNHHEEELKNARDELTKRITKAEETVEKEKDKIIQEMKIEIAGLTQKLDIAQKEMNDASNNLQEVVRKENERLNSKPLHTPSVLEIQDFSDGEQYDTPKSATDYIPEGTYFTGYLLTGIVVSTALNTPESNATPLTIVLKSRGNLSKHNKTDISKCRITGSAYGDLSSERAVIRLEKMVCEEEGMYITSHIAGDIHGPDGFNGIKGTVVSTGSKHIKNAMMGGLISGLAGSVKGQEGMTLSGGGLVSTKRKGFKDVAAGGLLNGASNAGEKIADYYLRQAESMSPVLTIPGGVRVNAHITRGFFIGELGTHRKIEAERLGHEQRRNQNKRQQEITSQLSDAWGEVKEKGSDEGWQ